MSNQSEIIRSKYLSLLKRMQETKEAIESLKRKSEVLRDTLSTLRQICPHEDVKRTQATYVVKCICNNCGKAWDEYDKNAPQPIAGNLH